MLTGNTSITQPRLPAGISRKSPSLSPLFLHPPTIYLSISLSLSLYHSLCETASRIFCPSPSVSGTHPLAQYVYPCTRISTSIYLCLFHSPRPLPPPSRLWFSLVPNPFSSSHRFHLRVVFLFLSLSNVALNDDVISYEALYIS